MTKEEKINQAQKNAMDCCFNGDYMDYEYWNTEIFKLTNNTVETPRSLSESKTSEQIKCCYTKFKIWVIELTGRKRKKRYNDKNL